MVQATTQLKGLPEFVFHHNYLAGKFVQKFGTMLRNDRFLRSIDLRFNHMSDSHFDDHFFGNFYNNTSLVCLDIRDNPSVKERQTFVKVATCLRRNVEQLKKKRVLCKRSWFIKEVLGLSKTEMPDLFYGLNFLKKRD